MTSTLAQALRINSPSDVGDEATLSFEGPSKLTWRACTEYGFHYHWLREGTGRVLEADFGLKIPASAEAALTIGVKGDYCTRIWLEPDGWLRLQVRKAGGRDAAPGCRIEVDAVTASPPSDRPDRLLAALAGFADAPEALARGLESYSGFEDLPDEIGTRFAELFGTIDSEAALARINEQLGPIRALRDDICRTALTALEKKCSAALSYCYTSAAVETPLMDCSFAFTEEGLALYRRALTGDFSGAAAGSDHLRLHQGRLSHAVGKETILELHLPFLEKKEWRNRLESCAGMEVIAGEDGRLVVDAAGDSARVERDDFYNGLLLFAGSLCQGGATLNDSFTLNFSDRRRLSVPQAEAALAPVLAAYGFDAGVVPRLASCAAKEIDIQLTLRIPGSLVSAWLEVPEERNLSFYSAFAQVSTAVQKSLRIWLPYIYFSDLDRYDELESAYSLLVYRANRPFSRKARGEYTYDAMNRQSLHLAFRAAGGRLKNIVRSVQSLLRRAGKTQTAEFYLPREFREIIKSVKRGHRHFQSLLAADAFFVGELVKLGHHGCQLQEQLRESPLAATSRLPRFTEYLVKAFHGRLRRLYGGQQFLSLTSLLFVEATSALSTALGRSSPVEAILRVKVPGDGSAGEHVFVNGAFRP